MAFFTVGQGSYEAGLTSLPLWLCNWLWQKETQRACRAMGLRKEGLRSLPEAPNRAPSPRCLRKPEFQKWVPKLKATLCHAPLANSAAALQQWQQRAARGKATVTSRRSSFAPSLLQDLHL